MKGKGGVLAPLVKSLVDAALEEAVESHIANDVLGGHENSQKALYENER